MSAVNNTTVLSLPLGCRVSWCAGCCSCSIMLCYALTRQLLSILGIFLEDAYFISSLMGFFSTSQCLCSVCVLFEITSCLD